MRGTPKNKLKILSIIKKNQWILVFSLWIFGLYLGFQGYKELFNEKSISISFIDNLYLTIQLAFFEGDLLGSLPFELQFARFFLPFLTAYTGFKAITLLFIEKMNLFRINFWKNHIVINTDDSIGQFAAKVLDQNNYKVVLVCPNASMINQEFSENVVVIIGDLNQPEIQKRSNLAKARYCLLFCKEDLKNIKTALQCENNLKIKKKHQIEFISHITDPNFSSMYIDQISNKNWKPNQIHNYCNILQQAAIQLINQEGLNQKESILLIGFGQLNQNICKEILIKDKIKNAKNIHIIDKQSIVKDNMIINKIMNSSKNCKINTFTYELNRNNLQGISKLIKNIDPVPEYIILNLDDNLISLQLILTLVSDIYKETNQKSNSPKIKVCLSNDETIINLLNGQEKIELFNLMDEVITLDFLLDTKNESLARSIHNHYIQMNNQREENIQQWNELSEKKKRSNRNAAHYIQNHLDQIGYKIIPYFDIDPVEPYQFSEQELLYIAQKEHQRWCDETIKENKNSTNPYLKPWDSLEPQQKEYNLEFVRNIPTIIANARYQIILSKNGKKYAK